MDNVMAATEIIIKGSVVNVRSGPGENYSKIASVKKGSTYKTLKTSNGWYNIALNSKQKGWIKGSFVTPINNPSQGTSIVEKKVMISGTTVNIRSGPGVKYKLITSLKKGTTLSYLKVSNNWFNIVLANKKSGWVSGNYVTIIKKATGTVPDGNEDKSTDNNTTDNNTTDIKPINKVAITVNKANIRKGPNTSYNIVAYGLKGQSFPLINTSKGWHNILLKNNQKAWVSAYVSKIVSDNEILTGDTIITDDTIITQDFIQVILPKVKGIMSYSTKTLQDPYRLVVTVNNVHPNSTSLSDIDVSNNPLVNKIEISVNPVKISQVTYTYYLSQPINYSVYSTPGDYIGTDKIARDTDSFDKKVTVKISPLSIKGKKIVIDAGHGGAYPDPRADSGAVARDSKGKIIFREKDFNLSMALLLASRLQELGAEVVLTRSTDVYIPLYNRTRIANQAEADIFISIHANSGSSSSNGTETIKNTSSSSSKPFLKSQAKLRNMLAEAVQKNVVNVIGTKNRGYYEDRRGLAVLRTSRMPSILLEVGFLSNPTEVKKLMSAQFQGKAADGIAAGINSYFTTAK